MIRKSFGYFGLVLMLGVMLAGSVAYIGGSTQADGLGRPLEPTPLAMRWVFGKERLWVGWSWFAIDVAVGLSMMVVGGMLTEWGLKDAVPHDPIAPSMPPRSSRLSRLAGIRRSRR